MKIDREDLRQWAQVLRKIREFFQAQDYLEVSTPLCVAAGAFEASIDVLEVVGSGGKVGQLQTSPELAMKEILSQVHESIYQITPCFRDDPPSAIHQKEFMMLEWYARHEDFERLMGQTVELVQFLSPCFHAPPLTFKKAHVADLWLEHVGIELIPQESPSNFFHRLKEKGHQPLRGSSWEDLFFHLWVDAVEPKLIEPQVGWLVHHFPTRVSPLSQSSSDADWAQRFEIYGHGIELCNGCVEETDFEVLTQRYEKQSQEREASGKKPHPYPHAFFRAVQKGFGPSSGVALGIGRLIQILQSKYIHRL